MRALLFVCAILVGLTGVVRAEEAPPLAPVRFDSARADRGRAKKKAAIAMMVMGTASMIAAVPAILDGAYSPTSASCPRNGCGHTQLGRDAQALDSGIVLGVIGTVLNLAGVGTYVAGSADVKLAEPRLSATASGLRLAF
jgi:hypothetical protein